MKQSTWETWFIISIILLLSTIFVGTLDGSYAIKSYPYIAVVVIINAIVSFIYGIHNTED